MHLAHHKGIRNLLDLFRLNALKLLEIEVEGVSFVTIPCPRRRLAFHQHLALILLNHPAFQLRYTVHFMLGQAVKIVARKNQIPVADVSKTRAVDYFKEYCNILAGSICNGLFAYQIDVEHSLPFAVQGYNDIFFTTADDSTISEAFFSQAEFCRIGHSIDLMVTDHDGLLPLEALDAAEISAASFGSGFDLS